MEDTAREIVGFFSRWCVLALSLLTATGVSWAAVLATAAMTADLGAEFVLPDVLCRQADDGEMLLPCYVVASMSHPEAPLILATMPEGGRQLAKYRNGRYHLVASRSRAGEYTVRVRAVPYGGLAFSEGKMKYHVVAKTRRVFLIDAAAVVLAPPARKGDWQRCVEQMKLCGSVALIVESTPKSFRRARDALKSDYGDVAILRAATDTGGTESQVRRLAWWLDPHKLGISQWPQVITCDAGLAGRIAARGLTVHLVSPRGCGISVKGNVRQYESPSELQDYFANLSRRGAAT
ncbi:MAG: hypothetical protein J7M14_05680 [Planctomycetes bacterium]|nr:hypothetical protein [Planctomycetota bacterium]